MKPPGGAPAAPRRPRRTRLIVACVTLALAGAALFARSAGELEHVSGAAPAAVSAPLASAPVVDAPFATAAEAPGPPPAPLSPPPTPPPAHRLRPLIYGYDLPLHMREPCLWPLTCKLHAAAASSPHRTLDGDEADYFWIPHKMPVDNETELRAILRIVVEEHPWFNASATARHIMVFSCDHGPSPCTWETQPCDNEQGLAAWPAAVNPASRERRLMFLSLNGVRDGADAGGGCCLGCFQRGRDIVVPPFTPGRDWDPDRSRATKLSPWLASGEEEQAFVERGTPRDGAPRRDVLLWFAGALAAGLNPETDRSGRAAVFAAFGSPDARDDARPPLKLEVLDTLRAPRGDKSTTFEDWAPRSLFCLDAMGTHGGWAARVVALLYYGCVPLNTRPADVALIFDEHPAVDWALFSVAAPSPLGPDYNDTLRAALAAARAPAELKQRRAAARLVFTRFLWSSLSPGGDVAGEPTGGHERDAWQTLLEILATRLQTAT